VLQSAFPNLKSKQNLLIENKPIKGRLKPTLEKKQLFYLIQGEKLKYAFSQWRVTTRVTPTVLD
jgi:hypothetical protein